jgi:WhiB family redox-sensing transcriptional regulator
MSGAVTELDWRARGACRRLSDAEDVFFGLDGESGKVTARREKQAKAVCAGCPVRDLCLLDALDGGIVFGVYGGKSESERADMIRARRKAAA